MENNLKSMNFGGIDAGYTAYDDASIAVLPVPFDATSTWGRGADHGPEAILEASANMELFDIQTQSEVYLQGIHTAEAVGACDDPQQMVEEVQASVARFLKDQKFPVVIGGNHSVCIGSIRAFAEAYPNLTVVQLDAHTDLRKEYLGSPLSHASVMARALDVCKVSHVGIRSMCVEELELLNPDRVWYAHDITGRKDWYHEVTSQISGPVYLTIDLDVFDPGILPSTGTPEPGGMLYYEVYNFVGHLISHCNIVGFDVVELAPNPEEPSSDFLASKLIYQILSLIFKKNSHE